MHIGADKGNLLPLSASSPKAAAEKCKDFIVQNKVFFGIGLIAVLMICIAIPVSMASSKKDQQLTPASVETRTFDSKALYGDAVLST